MVSPNYFRQLAYAAELMDRSRAYAASIGCTTYATGPLSDSIEVHTEAQRQLLANWWADNTEGTLI